MAEPLAYFYTGQNGAEVMDGLNVIIEYYNNGEFAGTGWSPVIGIATDGARRVYQILDWIGGTGTKPPVGYVGSSGIVSTVGAATDIRGPQGSAGPKGDKGDTGTGTPGSDGWTPVFAVAADGERRVYRILDWTGGTGSKPATGYLGSSGIVATPAEALDVRGAPGSGSVSTVNGVDPDSGGNVSLTADDIPGISEAGKSGSYNDLDDRPSIPAAQVPADWSADTGVARILNKPTIPTIPAKMPTNEAEAGIATTQRTIDAATLKAAVIEHAPGGASSGSRFFGPGTYSFVAPSNTIYVTACAGGADGNEHGPGGGGAFFVRREFSVTKGATLTINVGAKGNVTSITGLFTLNPGSQATFGVAGQGGAASSDGTGGVSSRGGHGFLDALEEQVGAAGGSLGPGGGLYQGATIGTNQDATASAGGDSYPSVLACVGTASFVLPIGEDFILSGAPGGYGGGGGMGQGPGALHGSGGPGCMLIEWEG